MAKQKSIISRGKRLSKAQMFVFAAVLAAIGVFFLLRVNAATEWVVIAKNSVGKIEACHTLDDTSMKLRYTKPQTRAKTYILTWYYVENENQAAKMEIRYFGAAKATHTFEVSKVAFVNDLTANYISAHAGLVNTGGGGVPAGVELADISPCGN